MFSFKTKLSTIELAIIYEAASNSLLSFIKDSDMFETSSSKVDTKLEKASETSATVAFLFSFNPYFSSFA